MRQSWAEPVRPFPPAEWCPHKCRDTAVTARRGAMVRIALRGPSTAASPLTHHPAVSVRPARPDPQDDARCVRVHRAVPAFGSGRRWPLAGPTHRSAERWSSSYPAVLKQFALFQNGHSQPFHRTIRFFAAFRHDQWIIVVGARTHNGTSATFCNVQRRIVAAIVHEDAGTNKHGFSAQLTHQRGIGRRGDTTGREVRHRQTAFTCNPRYQFVRHLQLLGRHVQLIFAHGGQAANVTAHRTHVLNGVYHVTGTRFPFGADHSGAFGNAAQCFAQVARTADERRGEFMLVDMVDLIGHRQHFTFVDEVDAQCLQYLRFSKVANTRFRHDGQRSNRHDGFDQLGISHAGNAAFSADLCRNPFQRHDRDGPCTFSHFSLFGGTDVHDDAVLEHFSQAGLKTQGRCCIGHEITP
ncbi:GTP cyclohydrolase II [Zymobacter palmae]|uniref:GTP cyclohydrolase II n=1 Tax=Zymobacter palmae TaxID=33074 RepID=A0A348HHB7_9GAMM|nr:GTP cyclohydrolase II [Zymobacter palmae]